MIFTVRRSSYFPILLEMEEQHALDVLEEQQRWVELEAFEHDLINSDTLKEIKVETERLDELLVFLTSLNHMGSIKINFQKKEIVILDVGEDESQ